MRARDQGMKEACVKKEILEDVVRLEESHNITMKEFSVKAEAEEQKTELTANKIKKKELTEQIAELKLKMETSRNLIHNREKDQVQKKEQFEQEVAKISLLVKKKEKEVHDKTKELRNTIEELNKLKKTHGETKKRMENPIMELKAAKVEKESLQAGVMEKTSKLELRGKEQQELKQIRARKRQLIPMKEEKEAVIKTLKQHMPDLQSCLTYNRSFAGPLTHGPRCRCNSSTPHVGALQDVQEQTIEAIGRLDKKKTAAKQQLAQLNNKIQSLETGVTKIQGTRRKCRADRNLLQMILTGLEVEQYDMKVAELKEIEYFDLWEKELQEEDKEKQTQFKERLISQLKTHLSTLAHYRGMVEGFQNEINNYRAQISQCDAELSRLTIKKEIECHVPVQDKRPRQSSALMPTLNEPPVAINKENIHPSPASHSGSDTSKVASSE